MKAEEARKLAHDSRQARIERELAEVRNTIETQAKRGYDSVWFDSDNYLGEVFNVLQKDGYIITRYHREYKIGVSWV